MAVIARCNSAAGSLSRPCASAWRSRPPRTPMCSRSGWSTRPRGGRHSWPTRWRPPTKMSLPNSCARDSSPQRADSRSRCAGCRQRWLGWTPSLPTGRTTVFSRPGVRPSRPSYRRFKGSSWRPQPAHPVARRWCGNAPPCRSSPSRRALVVRWRSGCCWASSLPPSWCGGVHAGRGRRPDPRRLNRGRRCPGPNQTFAFGSHASGSDLTSHLNARAVSCVSLASNEVAALPPTKVVSC
jgi:hypothetical protein